MGWDYIDLCDFGRSTTMLIEVITRHREVSSIREGKTIKRKVPTRFVLLKCDTCGDL